MIWLLDFLSVVMLVATVGWMILRISETISVTGLAPIQTVAVATVAAVRWQSLRGEKSRNDKTLR